MKKIIIIDDSKMMRMRLKENIESLGYEIAGEASNGKEGVALYEQVKPDAVSLDISMPEQGGIETLKQILEIDKEAKVVIVSAVGQKQIIIQALDMGAKDFIVKPFDSERIKATFTKILS